MGGLLTRLGQFLGRDSADVSLKSSSNDDDYDADNVGQGSPSGNIDCNSKDTIGDRSILVDDSHESAVEQVKVTIEEDDSPGKLQRTLLHINPHAQQALMSGFQNHVHEMQRQHYDNVTNNNWEPETKRMGFRSDYHVMSDGDYATSTGETAFDDYVRGYLYEMNEQFPISCRYPDSVVESSILDTMNEPFPESCRYPDSVVHSSILDTLIGQRAVDGEFTKRQVLHHRSILTDDSLFEVAIPEQYSEKSVPACKTSFSNDTKAVDFLLRSNNFRFTKPEKEMAGSARLHNKKTSLPSSEKRHKKTIWDQIIEQRIRWRINKPRTNRPVRKLTKHHFASKKSKVYRCLTLHDGKELLQIANPRRRHHRHTMVFRKRQQEAIMKLKENTKANNRTIPALMKTIEGSLADRIYNVCNSSELDCTPSDFTVQYVATSTNKPSGSSPELSPRVPEASEITTRIVINVSKSQKNKKRTRNSLLKSFDFVPFDNWPALVTELDTIDKLLALCLSELFAVCLGNISRLKLLKLVYGQEDDNLREKMAKITALNDRVDALIRRTQHYMCTFSEHAEGDDTVMELDSAKHKLENDVLSLTLQAKDVKEDLNKSVHEATTRNVEKATIKVRMYNPYHCQSTIYTINSNEKENASCAQRQHHHHHHSRTNEKDALAECVYGYYDDFHLQGVKGKRGPKHIEERIKPKRRHMTTSHEQTAPQGEVKLTKRQRKQMPKSKKK